MCCPRVLCAFVTMACWPASTWPPNCCVADNFSAKKRSPLHPHVRVGSTACWSGPAKIRCVVRFAKACWREARWRKRHLRRALQHPCRHRFGAHRLPTRIHPDPHGEGIGKEMQALAVKGAIIPTVRGARRRLKSSQKRRGGASQTHHGNGRDAFPSCVPTISFMLASTSERDPFR